MDTPGVSIFQSVDGLKVNSTLEREQEEEAEEDQRRRNEELGNLLLNAFDDLADDETTMDSMNYQDDENVDENIHKHHLNGDNMLPDVQKQQALPQHPVPGSLPLRESNQQQNLFTFPMHNAQKDMHHMDSEAYEREMHKMKMLLESRTNELTNIKQLATDESRKNNELQKRLLITEAELNRALTAKNNTHELLVESKEKCSNLEDTISKLRNDKKEMEGENNVLLGKLETTSTLLADLQQKYDMVERDLNKHNERNAELKLKQLEDRHRTENEILHQQREQMATKYDKKCSEYEQLNIRYQSLQQSHETMQVDKATKINDLNHALCEAQRKVEELLSKPDYHQENMRLQKLVSSLQSQIHDMEETISKLQGRLDQTTAELNIMDSVLQQHNLDESPRSLSQTHGPIVGSTPVNPLDRMPCLKDELYRSLANLKSKREEVRKLQAELNEKSNEIKLLREQENKDLVQISTLKEENLRLHNRVRLLEEQSEDSDADSKKSVYTEIQELNQELEVLRNTEAQLEKDKAALVSELEQLKAEHHKLEIEVKNSKVDLEEMREEYENMKRNYEGVKSENQQLKQRKTADNLQLELERHKFLLKDAQSECDRLKTMYVEIVNAKETLSYEIEKLKKTDTLKELTELRDKTATLQRALQLAEIKGSELSKILENEKLTYERDMRALREKYEKERIDNDLKAAKDNANNCTKCIELMADVTKMEISNLKLNNTNAAQKSEIDELMRELDRSKELISDLRSQLNLREQQEELIKELKAKAKQFEEFINSQGRLSGNAKKSTIESSTQSTPTKSPRELQTASVQTALSNTSSKGISTSPELHKDERRKIEARIRDEMAQILAKELKRYQLSLRQLEEKNLSLQTDYDFLKQELQQREHEVEILKAAILAEREKIQELIQEKDAKCQEVVQKHVEMLHRCRDELKLKNQRIAELSKELEERQAQIKAERESMKVVMTQWEAQRKNIDDVENEWKEKLRDFKKIHNETIESWLAKYNSAKRTAANYKRYAEDKEAHMLKEYDRLKFEYDANLAKIEKRMREAIEEKQRELKDVVLGTSNKKTRDKSKRSMEVSETTNKDNLENDNNCNNSNNNKTDEQNKENQVDNK